MISNRQEYQTSGGAGERFLYRELLKIGIPKNQIFRNVYISVTDNREFEQNKTTEIDILMISKKGIFIFEHKNFQGKIYGDGESKRWIQVYHGKREFLSPIAQNDYHRKYLRKMIDQNIPIYSFVSHSAAGKWVVRNLPRNAYFLQKSGDFMRVYQNMSDCPQMTNQFHRLIDAFGALSRPGDEISQKHIANLKNK